MTKNRAEWACEHGQITKIRLSHGCGGETIPMTVKIGSCRSRFDGYLGNVSLPVTVVTSISDYPY